MHRDSNKPLVAIMAGGTGGHIFPALAIAEQLYERGAEILWIGSQHKFNYEALTTKPYTFQSIAMQGVRGKGIFAWIRALWLINTSLWKILWTFLKRRPVLAIGMGGFTSAPGGLAAFIVNIPLVIHEQNAIPGLANRLLAVLSEKILTGFPRVLESKRTQHVGNPIRFSAQPKAYHNENHQALQLLVMGGSLGASIFNQTMPLAISRIDVSRRPQVKQQCGKGNADIVSQRYAALGLHAECFDFNDNVEALYQWADLIVCRAGAMTVAEVSAIGLPAIMVPFMRAVDNHQTANAKSLEDSGAAIVIPEKEFDPDSLAELINEMSDNRSQLQKMSQQALRFAMPNSQQMITDICCEVGGI